MIAKNVVSFDQRTGEKLDGVIVYCGVKQNPYNKGWIMNSQEALKLLAKDKEITGETYRVLFFICARLDFENWIQVAQKEIGEELEMKRQNVSRAILLLEKKGIIFRGPKIGKSYAFRLNPDFGWKGKVKNLNDYRREEEDLQRREFKERHLRTVDTSPQSNQ